MPYLPNSSYPWTKIVIEHDLEIIPSFRPKVLEQMAYYLGRSEDDTRRIFFQEFEPRFVVTPIPGNYGWTTPGDAFSQLDKTFVEEFESLMPKSTAMRNARAYAHSELESCLLQLMESTVLHETLHFYRYKTEQGSYNMGMGNKPWREEEIADTFEARAYGGLQRYFDYIVLKYMPRTAKNVGLK